MLRASSSCHAPRLAGVSRIYTPVKADELTESRDLHEIYRRQACFRFATSSYSSKVVGTTDTFLALEISSLVTIFRQREGWRRNDSARSANHARAIVL